MASSCPKCGADLTSESSAAGLCAACLLTTALSSDAELDLSDDEAGPTTLGAGTTLGPFRITRLLGRGGMATVYEGHDPRLDRAIALKVLPPEFLHDAAFAKRFAQEARVVASLEHPNIVPIYASGIDNGIPWMSMRLLAGGDLGELVHSRRPDAARIVQMLRDVAGALDYAHARGIVHRDIKPSNILLDGSGQVSVGDFGLAFMLEGGAGLTRQGLLAGTPQYMAPEQALGKPADRRCDIYSLAIVTYEMFVGTTPYNAGSPVAILLQHVNDVLPEPADGSLPRPIMRAIQKGAAKDPGERWESATAFVDALEAAVGAARTEDNAESVPGHPANRSRIRWVAAVAVGATVAATVGWLAVREPGPAPGSAPRSPLATRPSDSVRPTGPTGSLPHEESIPSPTPATPRVRATPPTTPTSARSAPTVPPPRIESAPPSDVAPGATPQAVAPSPSASTEIVPAGITREAPNRADPDRASPTPPVRDVITPPVRIRTVRPDYPDVARAAQIEGDVLIQAVVTTAGTVKDVVITRSVHPLLDEAARKAVLQYEYTPGRRNGIPEPTGIRITVSFRMR